MKGDYMEKSIKLILTNNTSTFPCPISVSSCPTSVSSSFSIGSDEEYKHKNTDMILPEIIYEPKNGVYVAKLPNGERDVDILKPNHGDKYDLEKGLLYYVIKKNLDLGKVLEWMKPILDESQRPENIIKR